MRGFLGVHFVTVYHFGKGMNKGEKLWVAYLFLRGEKKEEKRQNKGAEALQVVE
jgi:hypothetical protein